MVSVSKIDWVSYVRGLSLVLFFVMVIALVFYPGESWLIPVILLLVWLYFYMDAYAQRQRTNELLEKVIGEDGD